MKFRYKLHYIGKSNKDFTHDNIYTIAYGEWTDDICRLTIKTNRGYKNYNNYFEYFDKNFRKINKLDEQKLIRKLKLKKIKNESVV